MLSSDDSYDYDYDCTYKSSSSEYDSDDDSSDREYFSDSKILLQLNQHDVNAHNSFGNVPRDKSYGYCELATKNYGSSGGYFKANMEVYLLLRSRLKKRYVYLFIRSHDCYDEKIYPTEDEKSLIQYHLANSECDKEFIKSCFK